LSWIKRIFTMFQNDDDEFDDIEREQSVQKPVKQDRSQKKDLEAKVLYQYPKGQFRFPLIPDGNPGNQNPRKERKERVGPIEEIKPFINEKGSFSFKNDSIPRQDSNQRPRRKSVEDTKDTHRTKRAEKVKEPLKTGRTEEAASKFRYEPRKDSKPKFTQPFKPTEIPSPIYAFNRPPRKEQNQKSLEDVEYELTGFEKEQENKALQPIRNDIDFIQKEAIQPEQPMIMEKQEGILLEQPDQIEKQDEVLLEQPNQIEKQEVVLLEQPDQIEKQEVVLLEQADQIEKQEGVLLKQPDQIEMQGKLLEQDRYIEDDLAEAQDIETPEIEDEIAQFNLETEALDVILSGEVNDHQVSAKGNERAEDVQLPAESVAVDEDTDVLIPRQNEHVSAVDREELEVFAPRVEDVAGKVQEAIELTAPSSENPKERDHQTFTEAKQENVLQANAAEEEISYTETVQPNEEQVIHLSENSSEDSVTDQGLQQEEEQTAEPKRQLPFNVLMLKQDKRKWEARNMSKYPSFMTDGRKADAQKQPTEDIIEVHAEAQTEGPSIVGTASANSVTQGNHPVERSADAQSFEREVYPVEGSADAQSFEREAQPVEESADTKSFERDAEPAAQEKVVPVPVQEAQGVQMHTRQPAEELAPSSVLEEEKPGRISDGPSEVHPAAVYDFPPLDLLNPPVFKAPDPEWLAEQEHMLNETLRNFNVGARVVNVTQGPSVTRFEVQPEPGVKVNKITNLSDDIKLSLAAKDIRIEAPIPGKHTIGIEVPNHSSRPVLLSEILQSAGFMDLESPLSVALGLDIAGNPIVTDLKKMPHGLIAGATGSGKSVCINTMLVSLLYKAHPDEVKLLLIDPKMVELAPYNRIPHLVSPVITDVKAATASLKWAVEEMERRYELFAHTGVRDISRFNELAEKHRRFSDKLPYIVIVIDELADLMMMAPGDVEEAICRIAQKARACGIHLIIATQRPSVDVITGLIKANVPTRIAFSVSSQVDSRTIIDISGAEKLLGRGDMLFLENGSSKPFRLQGTFVTDNEIDDIVAFVREQRDPQYLFQQDELLKKAQVTEDEDELFYEACEFVIDQGGASTSSVQRRFKIGYNRAARLIEMMEQQGFISEGKGSKPRDVLITASDLESLQETSTFN
jgi:DNA segregation ATPase FtsK/SpoIIIE, S-DNA-T family